jgi:hypothetical protein
VYGMLARRAAQSVRAALVQEEPTSLQFIKWFFFMFDIF